MNWSTKSKAELIAQVEDWAHLPQAIESKDAEILQLQKQLKAVNEENFTISKKHDKAIQELEQLGHLSKAVEVKDQELLAIKLEKEKLQKEFKEEHYKAEALEKLIREKDIEIKTISESNHSVIQIANGYINNFRSLLKAIQGQLELAVELEALLAEKINPKKEGN